jgi:DNA-binding LytR/AlgR family response regulator
MMRCIAVDDEPLALDLLEDNIKRVPYLQLVKRCKNAFEANEVLVHEKIDLIFLDVQMPGISGIQFLQSVKTPPLVIFITAYEKFALEGFNLNGSTLQEYLFVNADYNLLRVNLSDILYIEGLKDYVKIFLSSAPRPVITRMSMKTVEEKLPSTQFSRIHKSFIVSIGKIVSIRRGKISIGSVHIPISEHYRDNLYRFIDPNILN